MSRPGASLPPRLSRLRVRLLSLESFNSANPVSPLKRILRELRPHQENFNENCNWRDGVLVKVIAPAKGMGFPSESMIARLSLGDVKFARLMILKKSARNCALKVSEILGIGTFLDKETSRSTSPGPVSVLRPSLPNRVLN